MCSSAILPKPPLDTIRSLSPSGHVGFDSLPNQLVNGSLQNGFVFNVMCIGETGLGKSTLMNTLFNTSFESTPCEHTLHTVKLKAHMYELQENNVKLKLTICDTLGYGDQINKADSFKAVIDYIDVQFESYLQEELKINRSLKDFHDSRIHACLYFICPTGHGLKTLDLLCMKELDRRVNIIPIIAKADAITKSDLQRFKASIMEELNKNKVNIYEYPTNDDGQTDVNQNMNNHVPFAVVGSNEFVNVGNKQMRARQYPWGIVQIENESHCDFVKLREMLIRTNMEDMREQTHTIHYELYRRKRLGEMGFGDVEMKTKAAKKEEVLQRLEQRRITKDNQLKEMQLELQAKSEQLNKEHEDDKRKLEEARIKYEEEFIDFSNRKIQFNSACQTMTMGKRGHKK
ncbi:septin-2-like isoform X2 [Glossina fuscipes]|uniref:Septin n=1 Tax=Glossina fuscipes TaxID=7396 RepID=A0A8U0WAX9_9MUSC|nr:septin-2-like isoform X2 [Glossina fuscipes]